MGKINIRINDQYNMKAEEGITVEEIINHYKKYSGEYSIAVKKNNILLDYDKRLFKDSSIEVLDIFSSLGSQIYVSGLKFVTIAAVKELWNKKISFKYSLDKGIYAEINKNLSDNDIVELKLKMEEIISNDYRITKHVTSRKDAIKYFNLEGDQEKAANILNIPNNYVELYELNHMYNYFYSNMPISTGVLKIFDVLRLGKNGIVLLYPRGSEKSILPEFVFNEKIYNTLLKYDEFNSNLNVEYVSSLNKVIASSNIQMFIKMNNIFLNDSLYDVAKEIKKRRKELKVVLIGGPSSSGKTTCSKKICTFLSSFGLKPMLISTDDYFKDRKDTPKDKDGNYDFESFEAMDADLFNDHLKKLLAGEEIVIPKFDFVSGKKLFDGDPVKTEEKTVLIIEGLHCLNEMFSKNLPNNEKYKILVCPFTPLGVDKHNHVSTTDMRLLRRIVRDNRVRNYTVEQTLDSWPRVVAGENKYIFPHQNNIDAVLNTAFAYEIGILKVFAEPLLYSVPMKSKHFEEARRLISSFRNFFTISSKYVEDDSILREFIGGSIYE